MQNTKLVYIVVTIAILLLPAVMQIAQPALAQTTADMPVYLKVYAEPNPVGVGQTVYVSLFFTKPIPIVGSSGGASLYTGLTVNIVKPDGTNQTLGPYTSDTTGGVGGIEFIPDVSGNYTVQAFYKGQTITGTVSGAKLTYNILATMSDAVTFTVQDQPIQGNALVPLPTEYWSRPIYATNYQWSQLGGNWWGLGKPSFTDTGGYDATGNNYNAYSEAPNSAHIMWVRPTAFGGQVGGPISGDQESQYTSTSILYRQFEPIIMNGIIYYKDYPNTPTTTTSVGGTPGWDAVDLRTGELIWHKDTNDTLVFGMTMQFHTVQEYGTQAFLVAIGPSVGTGASAYNVWQLFDPMTGYFIANITNVPNTVASGLVETDDDSSQGAVYIHTINGTYPNLSLTLWNSTLCLQGPTGSSVIRPSGNINYTRGYQWSVAIPSQINGQNISDVSSSAGTLKNPTLSIAGRTNDVILLRSYGEAMDTFASEFGENSEIELAMSAKNGTLLWGPVNRTEPRYHEVSVLAAGDGYYVEQDKDTNQAFVYNLNTGAQVGGAIQLVGNALSSLERGGAIAYGKAYIWDFGGYVNAIDLANGTLAWTYEPRDAGYNTPYGIYPLWHFGSHSIADGKLFLSEGRMYDPPLFSDAHKIAINCTDGSLVWSSLGYYGREPSAIADGYLVAWNSYDCQIYTYGKGPTKLTVSAPQTSIDSGKSLIISGTITDISSGTTDSDRSARFPNGVGCVSDASQSDWMAYVYMQQPKPTNATGVLVTLSVVDANGNYRTIGTTTSTVEGYYTFTWTPDISGSYVVYAQFGGSESYWPSSAVSSFVVDQPAQATSQPTSQPVSIADQYFLPGIAAVIVVIVIVGALIILLQRKHP